MLNMLVAYLDWMSLSRLLNKVWQIIKWALNHKLPPFIHSFFWQCRINKNNIIVVTQGWQRWDFVIHQNEQCYIVLNSGQLDCWQNNIRWARALLGIISFATLYQLFANLYLITLLCVTNRIGRFPCSTPPPHFSS